MIRWLKYSFVLMVVFVCARFSIYWFSRSVTININSSATRDLHVNAVYVNDALIGSNIYGELKAGPVSLRRQGLVARIPGRSSKIGDEYKIRTQESGEFVCHLSAAEGGNCSLVRLWVSDDKLTCYCDGFSPKY
jgi:hypothetical protein